LADVASDHAGLASGLRTTAHETGAALGVAILSAVATVGFPSRIPHGHEAGKAVNRLTVGLRVRVPPPEPCLNVDRPARTLAAAAGRGWITRNDWDRWTEAEYTARPATDIPWTAYT